MVIQAKILITITYSVVSTDLFQALFCSFSYSGVPTSPSDNLILSCQKGASLDMRLAKVVADSER